MVCCCRTAPFSTTSPSPSVRPAVAGHGVRSPVLGSNGLEPLSALDSAVRRQLRNLIREVILSSGVPAVLVTHDAEEAEELGDVVIAYNDGRMTGRRIVERPVRPEPQRGAPESTEST